MVNKKIKFLHLNLLFFILIAQHFTVVAVTHFYKEVKNKALGATIFGIGMTTACIQPTPFLLVDYFARKGKVVKALACTALGFMGTFTAFKTMEYSWDKAEELWKKDTKKKFHLPGCGY